VTPVPGAVDVHAHVVVPELLHASGAAESWRPRVGCENGRRVVEHNGRRIHSVVHEFADATGMLAALSEMGIEHALLSPWVPLLFYDIDAREGLERCRLQNLGLGRLREAHARQVSVLGAVPLQDPELAAAELTALMATGAFAGVEITASVNGVYLGDVRFEPFWAAAERNDALVFVHPTTRAFSLPIFAEHYLWNLVGNPMETTIAAAHLILGGTMERHPALRVLLAHGGGAIAALAGRISHGQAVVAAASTAGPSARVALRRFLFDTVTHDPRQVRTLVEAVGADRVLLGTDYPFDMADARPAQTVAAAGLDEDAVRALIGANAARELRLTTTARSQG
jgi:aminocarboxymuconate-semialdehyde decarboxylase